MGVLPPMVVRAVNVWPGRSSGDWDVAGPIPGESPFAIAGMSPLKSSYEGIVMFPRVVIRAAFMAATVSMARAQRLPPLPVRVRRPAAI